MTEIMTLKSNQLEKFLLDVQQMYSKLNSYNSEMKVYKERYNERFFVIYLKQDDSTLKQSDYSVAGYYDCINNCLYNIDYRLITSLENSEIKRNSFSSLFDQIYEETLNYLQIEISHNTEELKSSVQEEFNNNDEYYFEYHKRAVEQIFVSEDINSIPLNINFIRYFLCNDSRFENFNIYCDYLNNPSLTISNLVTEVMKAKSDLLGKNLLEKEYKNNYLNEIKNNLNSKYNYLHLNKTILKGISNIDAKTVTITLNYGGKKHEFKYDKSILVNDLKRVNKGSNSYNKSYDSVNDFLHEVKGIDSRSTLEFDFSNIVSITYNRKELYNKEEDNDLSQEIDEIELER